MKSYTQLRNTYGTDTKNTSSSNLTYGDEMINDFHRELLSRVDWPFLHRLRTIDTVADTEFVALPFDTDQVDSVFVEIGSTRYTPIMCPSREYWDELHYTDYNSDIPEYWFNYDGKLGLWPTPSTSGNTISVNCKVTVRDLNIADITNQTIATLTNGATGITLSGGLTAQMVGFWIRPTFTTTANTGDGNWYELASITNSTTGVLVREYGGVSIAAGSAECTISQMPLLPEAYHHLLHNYAAFCYWFKEGDNRAIGYKEKVDMGVKDMFRTYGFNNQSYVIDPGVGSDQILNPNLVITL